MLIKDMLTSLENARSAIDQAIWTLGQIVRAKDIADSLEGVKEQTPIDKAIEKAKETKKLVVIPAQRKATIKRTCKRCKTPYLAMRKDSRFCSKKCRVATYNEKARLSK